MNLISRSERLGSIYRSHPTNNSNTHEHSNSYNRQEDSRRKETENEKRGERKTRRKKKSKKFLAEEANRVGQKMGIDEIGICSCYIS